ncbi:MAG: HpcH/HpaI aldolase family protein [Candidatus Dormibacteraceae bacterium]
MRNRIRELMDKRSAIVGPFVTMTDPAVVELIALAGFDFAVIELEHAAISLETLQNHLRAAAAHGLGVLVRVPSHDPKMMLRVLDAGADGLLVPHVSSPEIARNVAASVRYPPLGHRGMGGAARSARYGAHGLPGVRELTEWLNQNTVLAVMIEDRSGVDQIEEIVRTPGIDIIHVGPSDLSASMGLIGTSEDPDLVAAVGRVEAATKAGGLKLGMPIDHGVYKRSAQQLRDEGAWLLTCGSEATFLLKGLRTAADSMRT